MLMKKLIALVLACTMVLTGCSSGVQPSGSSSEAQTTSQETIKEDEPKTETVEDDTKKYVFKDVMPEFGGLDDEKLLRYVEDNLYTNVVNELGEDYFVENVSAVYLSEEYLEELEYNSRENVYFGYSLSDLDEAFQGTRYIFTLGQNNETIVSEFEAYDDTYEKVIKNVAIGTGVVLICVTVSVATAGTGTPAAVSLIFATAAKTGTTMALSSGALSGVVSGVVTGVQTKDMDKAIKAGLLSGSESFKWGAITGAIAGGATETVKYAKAMNALKGVALNGITTQEAAAIQMESGYPIDIIKQFHSVQEYNVYKEAGLAAKMVNGELALVKNIDLAYKSELNGKMVTNLERMAKGYAPLYVDLVDGLEKAYQLHHIGQKADATLAILTEAEHQGNSTILNMIGKESEINRSAFDSIRKAFWKAFANAYM